MNKSLFSACLTVLFSCATQQSGRPAKSVTAYALPAELSKLGCLTQDQVALVLEGLHGQARQCYEKVLCNNKPTLSGKVTTVFVIAASGEVISVEIKDNSLHDEKVETCLQLMLLNMHFPTCYGGGTAEVIYPWIFKTAGGL